MAKEQAKEKEKEPGVPKAPPKYDPLIGDMSKPPPPKGGSISGGGVPQSASSYIMDKDPKGLDETHEITRGQGKQLAGPYDTAPKAEEGGDPNRLDPQNPATGSTQTPASANSLTKPAILAATAKSKPQGEVLGNAMERSNLGKGEESGYEFSGPYDYPQRATGKPEAGITAVGGWRSKTGSHSNSLWKSTVTARGTPAKNARYYKWSGKRTEWANLSTAKAMNILSKMESKKGGQLMLAQPNPGDALGSYMRASLKRKDRDNALAKKGGENLNKRRKGGGGQQVL
jgi:hypothetical protein